MSTDRLIETDVLVIGGGLAGTFAAIRAKELCASVILADKGYVGKSGAALSVPSTSECSIRS